MENKTEYTIKELCERYNITSMTIERYRKHKGLPFYKRGRNVFFIIEEVEEWMRQYNIVKRYNFKEDKEKPVN